MPPTACSPMSPSSIRCGSTSASRRTRSCAAAGDVANGVLKARAGRSLHRRGGAGRRHGVPARGAHRLRGCGVQPGHRHLPRAGRGAQSEGHLRPGQFVRVSVLGSTRPHSIVVPQRAVQQGPRGSFVWLVDKDGKAEQRAVEAGEWIGDDWLVSGGLKDGERVVVDGVLRLAPGVPMKVADAPPVEMKKVTVATAPGGTQALHDAVTRGGTSAAASRAGSATASPPPRRLAPVQQPPAPLRRRAPRRSSAAACCSLREAPSSMPARRERSSARPSASRRGRPSASP